MVSCDILGLGDDSRKNWEQDFVLGKSLEKIQIGDSTSKLLRLYGRTKAGISDGLYRSWSTFKYDSGKLAGVAFNTYNKRVDYISIDGINPQVYRGTTKQGIRLGRTREFVLNKLGKPDSKIMLGNDIVFNYCMEGIQDSNEVSITFRKDTVITIRMGHYFLYKNQPEARDCNWD